VLVLAHVPVSNRLALHTKLAAYRSYAIAAPLREPFPTANFSDMRDPYHYIRPQQTASGPVLIIGGEDHKTGKNDDTEGCFARLAEYSRAHFPIGEISHRWSGQIIEPADGLPFIGRNAGADHVYVATGFSGEGMTFGTLAAMLLSDAVLAVKNPWAALYDATRVKPLAQARRVIGEGADFPAHLAHDRLAGGEADSPEQVPAGEGRLVRAEGKMLAVYRDDGGALHARSAVCTHLGCYVHWNRAERSWDCPCHGSRFDVDGAVLNGPAIKPLAQPDDADEAVAVLSPAAPSAS
jgi:Rieske Fe-S protein